MLDEKNEQLQKMFSLVHYTFDVGKIRNWKNGRLNPIAFMQISQILYYLL